MRAKSKIYHIECFRCSACMRPLTTGDEFALRHDGLFCRHDHDVLEGGKVCSGAVTTPGNENNNNASLTNNNHHLHPNDGSLSGELILLLIKNKLTILITIHNKQFPITNLRLQICDNKCPITNVQLQIYNWGKQSGLTSSLYNNFDTSHTSQSSRIYWGYYNILVVWIRESTKAGGTGYRQRYRFVHVELGSTNNA